jgi:hypothetical protein
MIVLKLPFHYRCLLLAGAKVYCGPHSPYETSLFIFANHIFRSMEEMTPSILQPWNHNMISSLFALRGNYTFSALIYIQMLGCGDIELIFRMIQHRYEKTIYCLIFFVFLIHPLNRIWELERRGVQTNPPHKQITNEEKEEEHKGDVDELEKRRQQRQERDNR